ncbi:MAG: hypothetical protein ABI690_14760 [Chloroflexota bacterium]
MAVRVAWDNEAKTIIHYQFGENWTWEEYYPAKALAYEMISTVSHKVGVILETQHNGAIPHNLLPNFRNGLRTKHPSTVIVVIVVTRPFLRTMINTVRALSPLSNAHFEMVSTLGQARQMILDYLRTLQPDNLKQSDF